MKIWDDTSILTHAVGDKATLCPSLPKSTTAWVKVRVSVWISSTNPDFLSLCGSNLDCYDQGSIPLKSCGILPLSLEGSGFDLELDTNVLKLSFFLFFFLEKMLSMIFAHFNETHIAIICYAENSSGEASILWVPGSCKLTERIKSLSHLWVISTIKMVAQEGSKPKNKLSKE